MAHDVTFKVPPRELGRGRQVQRQDQRCEARYSRYLTRLGCLVPEGPLVGFQGWLARLQPHDG